MTRFTQAAFHDAARAGTAPRNPIVLRAAAGEPQAYGDGSRRIRFCFSDGSVDRMGDTIDPRGWDISGFMKNPVALFAHDSSAPPIGRASNVFVQDSRLMGDIEFAEPAVYSFADTVYRLVTGGFMKAVSVGFLPLDYKFADDDDRPFGIDFTRQELLEISVVPVPANANALMNARAKGIDTRPLGRWAGDALDAGRTRSVPRSALRAIRHAAGAPYSRRTSDPEIIAEHRRIVAEYRARIEAPHCYLADGCNTREQRLAYVQERRAAAGEVAIDPRLIVADAAFRLRPW